MGKRLLTILLVIFGCLSLFTYTHARTPTARAEVKVTSQKASSRYTHSLINLPVESSGCGSVPALAAGSSGEGALTSDGIRRTYWLHLPIDYQPLQPYPLVLNFHGYADTDRMQELYTGFSRLADEMGFIVVYPQGAIGPGGKTGWASGAPARPDTNDVLFVGNLLDALEKGLCIDTQRIYATGFSNGGGLTALLACRMATRIAAFASVSGSYYPLVPACNPGRAVPILEIHGTDDSTVPYYGTPKVYELPVPAWLGGWVELDDCQAQAQQFFSSPDVIGLEWTGCQGDGIVVHYRLIGGIHAWPGGVTRKPVPSVDQTFDATQVIWDFFALHPLTSEA